MSTTTPSKTKTKTEWKKQAVHSVTLPSGAVVDIKIPNLPALLKAGKLPNSLLQVANRSEAGADAEAVPDDFLEKVGEYHHFLVANTVVSPEITEDDVADLPQEDIDMLVGFATRQRDTDVIGHQLGGLEVVESFRKFRGLDALSAGVLGS